MHEYARPLLGGLLMGTACIGLVLFNGRILGVSGVLGGALSIGRDAPWRWAFIGGMVVAGLLASLAYPAAFVIDLDRSYAATLGGGLLIGAGTQLGSGCTSGHGICGIGRLSVRSLVATCVFMTGGALAVLVIQRALHGVL